MHVVDQAKNIVMSAGTEWVMWLLVALSVASIAIIIERLLALRSLRIDPGALRRDLVQALREGGFARARKLLCGQRHPAALVVLRVVDHAETETTPKQAEEAMAAEAIAQRRTLERRFGFLATLGANAPFIGLFGTVVGILQAFEALGKSAAAASASASAIAPQAVMSSIAEALVATAIGLGVAIPAVFAFNMFQRTVKSALDDAQMFSLEILSYLQSRSMHSAPSSVREPVSRPMHGQAPKSAVALS